MRYIREREFKRELGMEDKTHSYEDGRGEVNVCVCICCASRYVSFADQNDTLNSKFIQQNPIENDIYFSFHGILPFTSFSLACRSQS